jgi:hypothetical protein
MNVGGRNGGVPGRDCDLVQVRHDISGRIESVNRGALMRIDFQATYIRRRGTQPGSKFGTSVAAHCRIHDIEIKNSLAERSSNTMAIRFQPIDGPLDSKPMIQSGLRPGPFPSARAR